MSLIYAAARDLTDRIEAEQAVKSSEARYRLIADNTADVIWLIGPRDGPVHLCQPLGGATARLHIRGGP